MGRLNRSRTPPQKETVGYIKKIGKGRLVHLGVEPNVQLMRELLDYLKVPVDCFSTTKHVKTALFRRGRTFYLVAVNNGEEGTGAIIYLPLLDRGASKWRFETLEGSQQGTYEKGKPLCVEIPRKDGVVVKLR